MNPRRTKVTNVWPAVWGIGGVVLLLATAVARLTPVAREALAQPLGALQVLALVVVVVAMAWTEGYRGFQRGFAPRVVARARWLADHPRPVHVALAPLFCMGFFHATRRRRIGAFALTAGIVVLVLLVRLLPQPWRGIIDAGVVVGLAWGIAALVVFAFRALVRDAPPICALDLP